MRLYFHLRKSPHDVWHDDVGRDFRTIDEAYMTACREIPDMVAEFLRQRTDAMGFSFEVTDETERLVMEIPFREMVRPEPRFLFGGMHRRVGETQEKESIEARTLSSFSAFVHAPVPCLYISPNGSILAANTAFESSGFIKVHQLIGRPFFTLFPDRSANDDFDGRRKLEAAFKRVVDTKEPVRLRGQRYDIRGPGGEWSIRYWDSENWPIFEEDGTFTGIVHSGRPARVEPAGKNHDRSEVLSASKA